MSKSTKTLIKGCCYCMFVGGIALMLIGSLLKYLMDKYDMSYNTAGILVSLQSIGILGAGFLSGFFSALFGIRTTIVTGSSLMTLGFCAILFSPSLPVLFFFVTLGSIGYSFMNNMANSTVNDYTGSNPFALSSLHICFSVGATITPFIVMLFISNNLGWDNTLLVYGACGAAAVAVSAAIPIEDKGGAVKKPLGKSGVRLDFKYFKNKKYLVLVLMVFFLAGFQTAIFGWFITYFIKLGILSEAHSQAVISLLWGMMIVGRLAILFFIRSFKLETLLLITCSSTFLLFILCLVFLKSPVMIPLIAVMGLFLAGIVQLILGNVGKIIQNNATASGMLFSTTGLGGALVSYLVGLVADLKGIWPSMYVIAASAFLMVVCSVINTLLPDNKEGLPEQIKEPESPQVF